ncbi:hypothetical protein [Candidatus Albibeggiatoa sp. nov. NOAA]|uniref:hypothetical protein n=1 Tax=Candidatus Albibeggiatoa sp. nov. NOAA TaxID=3162724 RepID=UPI0032FE7011|nr:hypothetical protein [Thiotrichaceae bacterium]
MLKTLLNTFLVFILLLCTIVTFAWAINYLETNEFAWSNHFIPTVQAGYTPKSLPQQPTKTELTPSQAYQPILEPSVLPEKHQVNRRIEVRFPPDAESLSVNERKKLDGLLKTLELDNSQKIHILATPAPLKRDSVSSSHAAKLRAQSIARVVYPYTQHIDISYHPEMKPNRIIIEFP